MLRRTAAIMPDWLEFDPPGVESNRPTMLTEEKKRGPSLLLSFSLSSRSDRRKEPGLPAKRSPTRASLCTSENARAGTRISSHFLPTVHAHPGSPLVKIAFGARRREKLEHRVDDFAPNASSASAERSRETSVVRRATAVDHRDTDTDSPKTTPVFGS